MPTMVERVRAICKAKGIPVSQLEKDLGYANGYLNPKKAETIRIDRVAEIAQYLGVPLSDIDENCTDNGTIDGLQFIRDSEKFALSVLRNMTDDDIYATFKLIQQIKGGNANVD